MSLIKLESMHLSQKNYINMLLKTMKMPKNRNQMPKNRNQKKINLIKMDAV